jgi:hypothetical protein
MIKFFIAYLLSRLTKTTTSGYKKTSPSRDEKEFRGTTQFAAPSRLGLDSHFAVTGVPVSGYAPPWRSPSMIAPIGAAGEFSLIVCCVLRTLCRASTGDPDSLTDGLIFLRTDM